MRPLTRIYLREARRESRFTANFASDKLRGLPAMRKAFFISILALALGAASSHALVLWNLDNSANQTDPNTGVPWNAVAKVVNFDGSLLSGSAVYLGDGYLLSANHVGMDLTYSYITFDGVEFFSIDPAFNDGSRAYGKQVAAGVDMAVFKLTSIPVNAAAATLLPSADEKFGATNSATLIGWGVGRDTASPLATNNVTWGNTSTSAKRWGVNAPRTTDTASYDSYSYEAIITYAGNTNSGDPLNHGLGDAEAAATIYDSGSGLFQDIDGEWFLIGIATAVDTGGTSHYGNDSSNGGDGNYFARISNHEQQITALVPEPSTVSLLVATCCLGAIGAFLRRRHN